MVDHAGPSSAKKSFFGAGARLRATEKSRHRNFGL
jgi:hypothetical protein